MSKSTWNQEELQKLAEMIEQGLVYRVIAKRLGRSVSAVKSQAFRLGVSNVDRIREKNASRASESDAAYADGHQKRLLGYAKVEPSCLSPAMRAFWLAGYHDADMEMGNSVLEGAA